jgi:hypothetical protein
VDKKRDQSEEGRKLIPAAISNGGEERCTGAFQVYDRKIKKD